ncbi:MAG: hypothetical protein ACRD1S_00795 [Vicinamibacterales bacterium]
MTELPPLSDAMREVLRACDAAGGAIPVARLVPRSTVSVSVARASLSRTLRRLRLKGLLELEDAYGRTMAQRIAAGDAALAKHEADPDAAFEQARTAPGFFPFTTAAEYLD